MIHDVEGAYFNWYMEDKTSEEKVDYINRFGNLVVAYTNGEMLGSYENPYVTAERKDSDGRVLGTYVSTTTTLPQGLYILEEVQAPEGYVRQGAEGRYRKRNGQYFFEASAKKLPGMEAVHAQKKRSEPGNRQTLLLKITGCGCRSVRMRQRQRMTDWQEPL